MMLTNATITIYNHRYYPLTRFDTWHRTVIENVHVYVNHKASAGDSGLNSAEVYKIRIPTDVENADQYLPPEEYAKLKIRKNIGLSKQMIKLCSVNMIRRLKDQLI